MDGKMTIKALADALGVSKTAVRKYMTEEFRCEHTETNRNGVITIDSDGCKLIAMHLERTEKLAGATENKIPEIEETSENNENLVVPRVVWDALQEQLKSKDQQIADVMKLLDQAQQLQAGTLQRALPGASAEGSSGPVEAIQGDEASNFKETPSDVHTAVREAVRGLSFGERVKLLFGRKGE